MTEKWQIELRDLIQEFQLPKPSEQDNTKLADHITEAEQSIAKKDWAKAARQYTKLLKKTASVHQSSLFAMRLAQCVAALNDKTPSYDGPAKILRFQTAALLLDKDNPAIAFAVARTLQKMKRISEAFEKLNAFPVGVPSLSTYLSASTDAKNSTATTTTLKLREAVFRLEEKLSPELFDQTRVLLLCETQPSLLGLDVVWGQVKAVYNDTQRSAAEWKPVIEAVDKLRNKLVASSSSSSSSSIPTSPPPPMPAVSSSSTPAAPAAATSTPTTTTRMTPLDAVRVASSMGSSSSSSSSLTNPGNFHVPRFRIRVHQQGSRNEQLCEELGKMAHYQVRNGSKIECHWISHFCHIEWVVSLEPDPDDGRMLTDEEKKQKAQKAAAEVDVEVILNCAWDPRYPLLAAQKILFVDMEPVPNRGFLPDPWPKLDRALFQAYLPRNGLEWHLPLTWRQLSNGPIHKSKLLSVVVSGENRLEGHMQRIGFIKYLDKHWPDSLGTLDIYGKPMPGSGPDSFPQNLTHYRGFLPKSEKHKAFLPYKYTVAIENMFKPPFAENYHTEKFADVVVAEGLACYWGCTNLDLFVEKDCYLALDPEDFAKSLSLIVDAIKTQLWERRLPAIRRAKFQILNQLQLFPSIERLLLDNFTPWESMPPVKTMVLNLKRRSDRWLHYQKQVSDLQRINGNRAQFGEIERFEATDGRDLASWSQEFEDLFRVDVPFRAVRHFPSHGYNRAIVATAFSFVRMFRSIAADAKLGPDDAVLIHEDDTKMPAGYPSKWNKVWNVLRNDARWDIVMTGYTDLQPTEHDCFVHEGIEHLKHPQRYHGAGNFGLLVRKRAVMRFVDEFFKKDRIQQAFDHYLLDHHPQMTVYAVRPALVVSIPFHPQHQPDSDIQPVSETLSALRDEWLNGRHAERYAAAIV